MKNDREEFVRDVLTRSVDSVYPNKEAFEKALRAARKLKFYIGVDATGPHLHLGHLTNFLWLSKLQKLGHKIIFLIGDFTARIGDPTDKTAARQPLTEREVKANMRTFKKQVEKIVLFSGVNAARIEYNSRWYKKMTLESFMKLQAHFTVQQMDERDMFERRRAENRPINLQEFDYPILQGYDSVMLDVDGEVGGTDQTFNMLLGRTLMKTLKQKEKFVIATTILTHPKTGKKLMNKSEGGLINLDDSPVDIFGKIMAVDDESMFAIAEHCTLMRLPDIEALQGGIASSQINPRDAKLQIAAAVVEVLHGKKEAERQKENFIKTFSKKEFDKIPALHLKRAHNQSADDVVLTSGLVKSRSGARRLIEQGGFRVNDIKITDSKHNLNLKEGDVLKIGKKNYFKVLF